MTFAEGTRVSVVFWIHFKYSELQKQHRGDWVWWHSGGRSRWISLSSMSAWSTRQTPGQLGLHSSTLSESGRKKSPELVVYACNPHPWETKAGRFQVQFSLSYILYSRTFKNSFLFLKWKFIQNKIQSSSEDWILLKFANPANTTSVSPLPSQVSSVYFARAQTALASSSGLSHPALHSFTYSGYPETAAYCVLGLCEAPQNKVDPKQMCLHSWWWGRYTAKVHNSGWSESG